MAAKHVMDTTAAFSPVSRTPEFHFEPRRAGKPGFVIMLGGDTYQMQSASLTDLAHACDLPEKPFGFGVATRGWYPEQSFPQQLIRPMEVISHLGFQLTSFRWDTVAKEKTWCVFWQAKGVHEGASRAFDASKCGGAWRSKSNQSGNWYCIDGLPLSKVFVPWVYHDAMRLIPSQSLFVPVGRLSYECAIAGVPDAVCYGVTWITCCMSAPNKLITRTRISGWTLEQPQVSWPPVLPYQLQCSGVEPGEGYVWFDDKKHTLLHASNTLPDWDAPEVEGRRYDVTFRKSEGGGVNFVLPFAPNS